MKKKSYSRREFITRNSIAGAGLAMGMIPFEFNLNNGDKDVPAILGGKPVGEGKWPEWPQWHPETDEERVIEVLRSGVWSRSNVVREFEEKWAKTVGTKRCVSVVNGTNALICALTNMDIGAGDEVIIPPYTFIACPQAVLQTGAIPVFVDTDRETFQMDADKIEEKITPRTRAIMAIHIAGLPSDMERIMKIANKHDLLVLEDCCQAWTAEVNHKQVGTFGHAGCYSFQNSKNIPMGEGGAIVSDDEEFMDRCYSYHNYGNPYGSVGRGAEPGTFMLGTKLRLTEYQAAIGLAQLERFEEQTIKRIENAEYLRAQMDKIPGIEPYKLYDNVTRPVFHLFPFRYKKEEFEGLSRSGFRRALRAEGVPSSSGYRPLNKMPFIKNAFESKNFQKMYSEDELNYEKYVEENQCPENDQLCNEEGLWFTQNLLLGEKSDMDLVVRAIEKVYENAEKLTEA